MFSTDSNCTGEVPILIIHSVSFSYYNIHFHLPSSQLREEDEVAVLATLPSA